MNWIDIFHNQEVKMSDRRLVLWLGCVLSLFLVASLAFSAPQWVSLNGQTGAAPMVQVVDHSNAGTTLRVTIPGFWSEEKIQSGEIFQVLSFGDNATTMEVGAPMLPKIVELVAIPARSDLRVSVRDLDMLTLHNYRLYPFQTPTTDDQAEASFVMDQAAYSVNAYYPQAVANVSDPQIWRDVRLTGLELTPVRYNPVSRELVVARSFEVRIEYSGVNMHHALDHDPVSVNPIYDNMYRSAIINYDNLHLDVDRTDSPGTKYLVVVRQEALTHVQPLIDLRNAQGYKTEVKIYPTTGFDTDYAIKSYITSLFVSSALEYVLLVGDAYHAGGSSQIDVPMHMWVDSYSDSWYTSLQGDGDYFADLAIGRLVYDNMTELDRQVSKTMAYMQTPDLTANWAGNSLLVAHQEQYPQKYTLCKEQIRTFNYAIQNPTFATAYGGAGATNQQVIDYINNQGTGLLNYRGHGSATEWWQWGPSGSFTATHIAQLTNLNRYFVHFDVCCDNMNIPNYNGNCLAESFMKATAAAIAINGAIIPSYTIPNHDYDKEFYKALYNNGIWHIGYASNYANVAVVTLHGSIGQSNYRTYLWLGDAAIDLLTATPQQLTMQYEPTINLGSQDFQVTVLKSGQPVANALVCAQGAGAYARGFTNASGVAYLVFSEMPASQVQVNVRASAHNGLDATGTATIIPSGSPYAVAVNLTATTALVIPPGGGSFSYTVNVTNSENYSLPVHAWTDWVYPNSTIHTPFIDRFLTLVPGAPLNRSLTQSVGGSEPPGTYLYRGCVGTYPGGTIYAADTLVFTKSAVDEWLGEIPSLVLGSEVTGWDEPATIAPQHYALSQAPNPFNPVTTISFSLPISARVRLTIFDTLGREVAVLVDGYRVAGNHQATFDGSELASGIYLSDLQVGDVHLSGKMVLMK
jgi:hypothetical protein